MFARSFAAIILVLPTLAAASALPQSDGFTTNNIRPTQGGQPTTIDQCNTGSLQCCNDTQSVSYFASRRPISTDFLTIYFRAQVQSSTTATLLGLLGFAIGAPDTLIGGTCFSFLFILGAG